MILIRDDPRKEITLRKAAITIIVLVYLLLITLFITLVKNFGLCVGLIIVVSGLSTGLSIVFIKQIVELKSQLAEPDIYVVSNQIDNPLLVEHLDDSVYIDQVEESEFMSPVYIDHIDEKNYNENPPLIENPQDENNLL